MSSTLEDLFFEELRFNTSAEAGTPQAELWEKFEVQQQVLDGVLKPEEKRLLRMLVNTHSDLFGLCALESFVRGFRMGVQ